MQCLFIFFKIVYVVKVWKIIVKLLLSLFFVFKKTIYLWFLFNWDRFIDYVIEAIIFYGASWPSQLALVQMSFSWSNEVGGRACGFKTNSVLLWLAKTEVVFWWYLEKLIWKCFIKLSLFIFFTCLLTCHFCQSFYRVFKFFFLKKLYFFFTKYLSQW
jgi:hypothetical protein